jgi:hypothetical protein
MARPKKVPGALEPLQAYIEGVAKSLADRHYGPKWLPWGTPLAELEDLVTPVRRAWVDRKVPTTFPVSVAQLNGMSL